MNILQLTTHLNTGGITKYISMLSSSLVKRDERVYVASSGGAHESDFEKYGVQTITLDIKTKCEVSPKVFSAIPGLVKFAKEKKIDVIHAHTRVTQVLASYISLFTGVPHVSTCHGFYKRRLGRLLMPAWGKKIIAISETVKTDLQEKFFLKAHRIRLVPNGVFVDELKQQLNAVDVEGERSKWGLDGASPVIGYVSRLMKYKGCDVLVRTMPGVLRKYPRAKLLIAGDGDFRPEIEALIRELKLEASVIMMGRQENVAVPYQLMDIFIMPNRDREGFGIAVTEAMFFQKPVIVSNIGALNTIIQNGRNGLVFKPNEPLDLFAKLHSILIKPKVARQFVATAHDDVRRHYTNERMAGGISKVYREVIRGGKK